MAQQTNNLRVRRTQKLLREALIDLIEERSFDALTVGEITQRAMVSRAAFYRNYQDKYDLVEQIFEEAMHTLMHAVENVGPDERPPEVWVKFFEHIAEYERLYRALLGKKGSPWFAMKMRASLAEMVNQHTNTSNSRLALDPRIFADGYMAVILSALYVDTIIWWLEQGRPYSPREIATRSASLAASILKEAGTWE